MKRLLRLLLGILLVLLLYVGITLWTGTTSDWQPPQVMEPSILQVGEENLIRDSTLSLVIYNIGYAGLGAQSAFFYENGGFFIAPGKEVRPDEPIVQSYLSGSRRVVDQTKADFFLLQEVDSASRRSYFTNQLDTFRALRTDYSAYYAPNYRVARVPIPVLEPWRAYGQTESGLLTLSRFQPTEAQRLQLPGEYGWPTRIFQLDRCALLQRFPTAWGNELVLFHIHLSAYDAGGVLKKQQMDFLRERVLAEYEAGNYVVVGGDWNQAPPYFEYDTFAAEDGSEVREGLNVPSDFLPPDWQWVYDPTVATNRSVAAPYSKGETFTTIIDYYLLSPNMRALLIKTLDQDFASSDHQPVYLEVLLN